MLFTNSTTTFLPYSMTETMDDIAYAFYLAYGMDVDEESQNYLQPDVEMYDMIRSDSSNDVEASYRDFLSDYAQEVKDTSSAF